MKERKNKSHAKSKELDILNHGKERLIKRNGSIEPVGRRRVKELLKTRSYVNLLNLNFLSRNKKFIPQLYTVTHIYSYNVLSLWNMIKSCVNLDYY